MNLVGTTQTLHQHNTTTPSIFNTDSSEDLGEEQVLLNLVGTSQSLHLRITTTPSIFNIVSSEDLGKEPALLNLVGTTQPLTSKTLKQHAILSGTNSCPPYVSFLTGVCNLSSAPD